MAKLQRYNLPSAEAEDTCVETESDADGRRLLAPYVGPVKVLTFTYTFQYETGT